MPTRTYAEQEKMIKQIAGTSVYDLLKKRQDFWPDVTGWLFMALVFLVLLVAVRSELYPALLMPETENKSWIMAYEHLRLAFTFAVGLLLLMFSAKLFSTLKVYISLHYASPRDLITLRERLSALPDHSLTSSTRTLIQNTLASVREQQRFLTRGEVAILNNALDDLGEILELSADAQRRYLPTDVAHKQT